MAFKSRFSLKKFNFGQKRRNNPTQLLNNITILNYMKRVSNCKGNPHVIIFVFTLCSSSSINFSPNQVKVQKPSGKKYAKKFIISIMYIFIKHNVLWYKNNIFKLPLLFSNAQILVINIISIWRKSSHTYQKKMLTTLTLYTIYNKNVCYQDI